MIVVDASLIIALILLEDNAGDPGLVYDAMRATQIIAPAHWPAEIANALWANQRRGRISADSLSAAIDYLIAFKPRIDPAPSLVHMPALVQFADKERLTVYDAIYVQLALSNKASLATIDGDMRACAKRLNIPLIPA